jgi:hypothetical protein
MAASCEEYRQELLKAARELVGKPAIQGKKESGYGIDCFALVDHLLRKIGAKTAADFGDLGADADYVWGVSIDLDKVAPGHILQFRNHVVSYDVQKLTDKGWKTVESHGPAKRPHHTAIVDSLEEHGVITVIEQNVLPNKMKIRRSDIVQLDSGSGLPRMIGNSEKWLIEVSGTVKAYCPAPKQGGQ